MSGLMNVAVFGTGSLGKEHARLYAELAGVGKVRFAGVFDVNAEVAKKFAEKYRVKAFATVEEAVAGCSAASVVTPTVTHFELAKKLLEAGRHVLVEKPMTDNTDQAADLVRMAQERGLILQVGHVERFNPVLKYLESVAPEPRFIEAHRLSPYPARSTVVGSS